MSTPQELPNDPTQATAQRAFHLLGGTEAVITNPLADPATTWLVPRHTPGCRTSRRS
jgi:hypothetical protein